MLHELVTALATLADEAPSAPSPSPSDGVTLALIGVIGTIVAPFAVALASRLRRRGDNDDDSGQQRVPPPQPLNSDSDDESDPDRARVAVLETFLWRNHLDPTRVMTGEERASDVTFD